MASDIEIKQATKVVNKVVLAELCSQLDKAKQENNGKTPYGFVAKQVKKMQLVCPWLSRDMVMNEYRRRSRQLNIASVKVSTEAASKNAQSNKCTNGRPIGTTKKQKELLNKSLKATRNEIATIFVKEQQNRKKKNTRMRKGRLSEIIESVTEKNNLHDVTISCESMRQRVKRKKIITVVDRGVPSPLLNIEPTIVSTIIQLSRIRQSITPSQGIMLVNSIINGTPAQADLINWKMKVGQTGENIGKIEIGY